MTHRRRRRLFDLDSGEHPEPLASFLRWMVGPKYPGRGFGYRRPELQRQTPTSVAELKRNQRVLGVLFVIAGGILPLVIGGLFSGWAALFSRDSAPYIVIPSLLLALWGGLLVRAGRRRLPPGEPPSERDPR